MDYSYIWALQLSCSAVLGSVVTLFYLYCRGWFIANFKKKYSDEYLNNSSEEPIKQIILKEYQKEV